MATAGTHANTISHHPRPAMSLFGKIFSITDATSRIPQLSSQILNLEKEAAVSFATHEKRAVQRRAAELHKQVDELKKKVEGIRVEQGKKEDVLEEIFALKSRLFAMSPSSDYPSNSSDVKANSEVVEKKPPFTRRASMYDEVSSESEGEQKLPRIEEVEEPPQPKPRNGIPKQPSVEITVEEIHEDEDEEKKLVAGNEFVALCDYRPDPRDKSTDLVFSTNEVLKILETRDDGWWTAQNESGQVGLVPKTFLRHLNIREREIRADVEEQSEIPAQHEPIPWNRKVSCLGDALRCDVHLTYACHLMPRLSHSNLSFHDVYWNGAIDQIRKRNVRISRLIRLVRLEGMPPTLGACLLRVGLYDENRRRGRQIASNVHTIRATVKGSTWNFVSRADSAESGVEFGDFYLRSNYVQSQVVLLLEASHVVETDNGPEERSFGVVKLPLIGDDGILKIMNKTYVESLTEENVFDPMSAKKTTAMKMCFKILEVPKENVHHVDSMPDVLIFNPIHLKSLYFYRRRAGSILIRDKRNQYSGEMISDPLLAIFPSICDQSDIMDALSDMWQANHKLVKNKSDKEQAAKFFEVFLHTAFCLHATTVMPPYDVANRVGLGTRWKMIEKCLKAYQDGKTVEFLTSQPAKPINIFDYSVDLLGPHAID